MWRKVLTLGLGLALSIVIPTTYCWSDCSQSDSGGTWRFYAVAASDGWYVYGSLQVQPNGVIVSGTTFKYTNGTSRTVRGGQLYLNSACILYGHIHLSGGITVNVKHGALETDKSCFYGVWKDSNYNAGMATGVKK